MLFRCYFAFFISLGVYLDVKHVIYNVLIGSTIIFNREAREGGHGGAQVGRESLGETMLRHRR